jgi:hypothetical protein
LWCCYNWPSWGAPAAHEECRTQQVVDRAVKSWIRFFLSKRTKVLLVAATLCYNA